MSLALPQLAHSSRNIPQAASEGCLLPAQAEAILGPALPQSTGLQIPGVASGRSRVPWASKQQQGECPSTPSTSAPHSLALIPRPLRHILGNLPLAVKRPEGPHTPTPSQRDGFRPLKIASANAEIGLPQWQLPLAEGLWSKQAPLPASHRSWRLLFPIW